MSRMKQSIVVVASVLSLAAATGCELAQPLEGPGYAPGRGVTTEAEGPFFVATTHLVLKEGGEAQDVFDARMEVMRAALEDQPGLVGYSLAFTPFSREAGHRTMSVWESEEAMAAWAVSEPHVAAIVAMSGLVESGVTASWTVTREEMPPSWDDAKSRLDRDGIDAY